MQKQNRTKVASIGWYLICLGTSGQCRIKTEQKKYTHGVFGKYWQNIGLAPISRGWAMQMRKILHPTLQVVSQNS